MWYETRGKKINNENVMMSSGPFILLPLLFVFFLFVLSEVSVLCLQGCPVNDFSTAHVIVVLQHVGEKAHKTNTLTLEQPSKQEAGQLQREISMCFQLRLYHIPQPQVEFGPEAFGQWI